METHKTRKPIRLKGYDYSSQGMYFITICTKDKHCILCDIVGATVPGRPHTELTAIGIHINNSIRFYNANKIILIDKYVIMPNHIHMIIVINRETGDRGRSPLQNIVRSFKSYVTKQIGFSIWQRSFHDHIIRDEQDYLRIAEYIENNPVKWTEDIYYD